MIPKARFTPPPTRRGPGEREIDIPVSGGLHAGVPPHRMPAGFSPALRNYVPDADGWMTPRSGYSSYKSTNGVNPIDTGGVVLGAFETFDIPGIAFGVAISATSVNVQNGYDETWSRLSYLAGSQSWHQGNISAHSQQYFRGATIYDAVLDKNLFIFSNHSNSIKFMVVDFGAVIFSDFTWADSIDSTFKAKDVVAINDRLFLFNTTGYADHGGGPDITPFPKRAMWSARGAPRSFLIADGGGAEDIADMQGVGQAAVRWKEMLLLFTEKEIWRGIPTLDDYAFRFELGVDNKGTPFPKTIVSTPYGVIFMGVDLELYLTDGTSITPLGPLQGAGASRIQSKLAAEMRNPHRAWALYNSSTNRYELYYATSDTSQGFPRDALFYDLDTVTWWPQRFSDEMSAGVDREDNGSRTSTGLFAAAVNINHNVDLYGPLAAAYKVAPFNESYILDNGSSFSVSWKSPGFRNGTRRTHLKEVWVEYESASTTTIPADILVGSSHGTASFQSVARVVLEQASTPLFTPAWKTDTSPQFEFRIPQTGNVRPKIAGFSVTLQDASKF